MARQNPPQKKKTSLRLSLELVARFVAKEMSVIAKPVSLLTWASATRGKRVRAVGTGRSPKSATKEKDKQMLVFGAGGEI